MKVSKEKLLNLWQILGDISAMFASMWQLFIDFPHFEDVRLSWACFFYGIHQLILNLIHSCLTESNALRRDSLCRDVLWRDALWRHALRFHALRRHALRNDALRRYALRNDALRSHRVATLRVVMSCVATWCVATWYVTTWCVATWCVATFSTASVLAATSWLVFIIMCLNLQSTFWTSLINYVK